MNTIKPRVTSEYGVLRKVLIHTPGEEHRQMVPWEGEHPFMGDIPRSYVELQQNHGDLKRFLSDEIGKENVHELKELLIDIFDAVDIPRREALLAEALEPHLATAYLASLKANGVRWEKYDAKSIVSDLICGYPQVLTTPDNDNISNIIIPPKRELMWMRDSAATTPVGVVINSMQSVRRNPEPALVRSVFRHHPMFAPDTIFLDMVEFNRNFQADVTRAGLHIPYTLEGGNILVLSEDTLAVGVGMEDWYYSNRTNRRGFNLLVDHLFKADTSKKIKRIYLVNVPDLNAFIHLDTVFNMFAPKSAIAMPYIFGYPKPSETLSSKDILDRFVKWCIKTMGVKRSDLSKIPSEEDFEHAGKCEVYDREHIEQIGRIERLNKPSLYFFDQLAEDGLLDLNNVVWVGGSPDNYPSPYEHLRVALFEQHSMAANVFTVAPHRLITYHRNPHSIEALRAHLRHANRYFHLSLMSSNEIRTDNGGPRCLTMPLLRD